MLIIHPSCALINNGLSQKKKFHTERNMRFLAACQFTQLELFPDYTDEVNEEIINIYIRWVEFSYFLISNEPTTTECEAGSHPLIRI